MSHEVDSDLVRRLAALLEETGLGELEYATTVSYTHLRAHETV